MKKLFFMSFVLIFLLSSQKLSFALDPLCPTCDALLDISVLAPAYYYYYVKGAWYYLTHGAQSSIDNSGNISTPGKVQWVSLQNPAVVSKPTHDGLGFNNMQTMADEKNADGSLKYPTVNASVNGISALQTSQMNGNTQLTNGQLFHVDNGTSLVGQYLKVTGIQVGSMVNNGYNCSQSQGGNVHVTPSGTLNICADYSSPTRYQITGYSCLTNQSPPPPTHLPASAAIPNFTGTGSPGAIPTSKTALQAELDLMYQDPNYIPSFTDDTTGLPFSPPNIGDIMTPSQLATYNGINGGSGSQTAANAPNASGSSGAGGAPSGGTTPSGSGNSNGSSVGSGGTMGGTGGSNGTQPSSTQTGNIGQAGTFNTPKVHTLDFSNGKNLLGAVQNAYPINLIPSAFTSFSNFVTSSPSAPVFTFPLPLGFNLNIDLSLFNPVAKMCRYICSIIITAGSIMAIINFYRGTS